MRALIFQICCFPPRCIPLGSEFGPSALVCDPAAPFFVCAVLFRSFGGLSGALQISLASNLLTGSLPATFGALSQLTYLDAHVNSLTGTLPPAALANLTSLVWLDLRYNAISGPLPPQVGYMSSLTGLLLQSNLLASTIPTEIGRLTNLTSYLFLGAYLFARFPLCCAFFSAPSLDTVLPPPLLSPQTW